MRSAFALAALAATFIGASAQLTINTPSAVVEQMPAFPPVVDWRNSITSGDDATGATLVDLGAQTDNSETYTPTQEANTRIVFNLRDSTGTIAQTGIITVGAGSSTSCASSGAASGTTAAGSTAAGSTAAGSTGSTTAATGSGSSTSKTSAGTGSSSATSSGASAASTSNAAVSQLSGAGFAGVFGAALVALLA